jgi:hypothetical protein
MVDDVYGWWYRLLDEEGWERLIKYDGCAMAGRAGRMEGTRD